MTSANTNQPPRTVRIPTIHLNGSGQRHLLDQLLKAHHAGRAFQDALVDARPNARDYYVDGNEALSEAKSQHEARLTKVREVLDELRDIATAVQSHAS